MSAPIRPHPVGGVDYPRTFQEFQTWFPDDQACLQYLANRWTTPLVRDYLRPHTRLWQAPPEHVPAASEPAADPDPPPF